MAHVDAPEVLWSPSEEEAAGTAIAEFARWARGDRGVELSSDTDYGELHAW